MTVKTPKTDSVTFAALGLDAGIVAALNELGYEEPTPIQREAIPPLILGRDRVGQAATGAGKTAAIQTSVARNRQEKMRLRAMAFSRVS